MDSYAGDSNISVYLNCFQNFILNLQNDLKSIISWCNVNQMVLNATKSRFMIICTDLKSPTLDRLCLMCV